MVHAVCEHLNNHDLMLFNRVYDSGHPHFCSTYGLPKREEASLYCFLALQLV